MFTIDKGFMRKFYMDREFENTIIIIPGRSTLNTTATDENIPEIERHTRVTKKCARSIWSTLPLNKIPGRIVITMILFVVLYPNEFPNVGGIFWVLLFSISNVRFI